MIEPKGDISNLWGNQPVIENISYRMMKYVLRVDYEGVVLLHNVVTGHLVVLDQEESKALDKAPICYNPLLDTLIVHYFIVPVQYDEHKSVSNMRIILRKLADRKQVSELTFYTILPTTACNARCYYCFEKDVEPATMTKDTAEDVVKFITAHCNGKKVWLKWFGGEPTVAADRITQICKGLKKNGVLFNSIMTTNGYLFDKSLATEAKDLWNLKRVTLSMDGTGEVYNRIKDYKNAVGNPYDRVLHNVGVLIEQGIQVTVRMNFDQRNFTDFKKLLSEISLLYSPTPLLSVRAHFINDTQIVNGVPIYHGSEEWYNEKILELNQLSETAGFLRKDNYLPSLSYRWCPAASLRSVTITPQGNLVSCYELLDNSEIKGNVNDGITDTGIVKSWLRYADELKCSGCVLFPHCGKIYKCPRNQACYQKKELLYNAKNNMIDAYNLFCAR